MNLCLLQWKSRALTTGLPGKSHESPFFIYMSYSLWPYYVSWYHLFIFRMSFLFEKFLCNWLYKWEPNSRQHTGSIVENIICNKTKDTKQRPTPFFLRGLIAAQLLSNYMKQDQGSVSDSGHQCHPSATFSLDLRADTQWTLAPSLHWRVWEFPYNWNQEGLYWNTSVPPCPNTGVWRDISNLYHFLFTSSFHSWWPSFHILFWCRQTLFYTKPFRVERQIHSHEAAEKQSWLWLHSCWRGWTWRVSANQELGPRWSCRPGWQDGNRYETPHGPVWSGPDNTVVSWACHCPLKTWRISSCILSWDLLWFLLLWIYGFHHLWKFFSYYSNIFLPLFANLNYVLVILLEVGTFFSDVFSRFLILYHFCCCVFFLSF